MDDVLHIQGGRVPESVPIPPGVGSGIPDPLGLTWEAFRARTVGALTLPGAKSAYQALFRRGTTTSGRVQSRPAPVADVQREESPEGPVLKFSQRVPGASGSARLEAIGELRTESVLIPMIGRRGQRNYTLCVSSQVGCAMGCTFCETAQMGLVRSLTPAEIVGQWFAATHVLKHQVRNVVFMGMGEPLDNYDNVIAAIGVLIDHNGPAMAVSKITISTVGRLDGLARLREQIHNTGWHRLNLAVSLNAPSDAIRSQIMPVNRGMPMAELRQVLVDWPVYGGGKLCLEYVVIPGVNDRPEHAKELADFVGPIDRAYREKTGNPTPRVMLNVIPYNPRRNSPWPAPREEDVDAFLAQVSAAGIYAKRRRTKGRDLMGACGQLGSEAIRGRKLVGVTTEGSPGT